MKQMILLFAGVGLSANMPAQAEILDSVRFGILDHNVQVLTPKNSNKEPGVNISAEVRFSQLDILGNTWSPHPYAMVSANTKGSTSYIAAGFEWDFEFAKGWHFQPGLGYAIHSGELDSEGDTAAQRAVFESTHLLLGSRDLFRTSFALSKDINEQWGVQLIYDHLSHGQMLGNGRNQGLDDVGLRVTRTF
ncbi:acyloxyacyl hydrolase [Hirschia baltica]|uniref:Lipid A 3-O-deacylase-related protein n=1 Tax=Hirschia baltica (strain ATCC 49814 / DSM 5838 / IFAM 1418) TaxID=582402 RepID=C6XNC6_HIRBI|nr:acyloxyacyl hydrolase [Hirschia baltica]ACT60070.1 conserved hypothetical protein [Hirschia baltica ATCC 49814]